MPAVSAGLPVDCRESSHFWSVLTWVGWRAVAGVASAAEAVARMLPAAAQSGKSVIVEDDVEDDVDDDDVAASSMLDSFSPTASLSPP